MTMTVLADGSRVRRTYPSPPGGELGTIVGHTMMPSGKPSYEIRWDASPGITHSGISSTEIGPIGDC